MKFRKKPIEPVENQGWICPKCGKGVSPLVVLCPCNPPLPIEIAPDDGGCLIAAYFRAHPKETSVNLYCGCPRCSATC